ncbi:Zn-ribbon domain-containing OB-fold protein [Jongsikchunia kroppenstedtii]|uniref:Zn-ribbon domain-containing OB-fold protein n=1 Tax=Jongsikchunia kroppenstedtii TaxID=1121721 RepID=UPI000366A9DF|nr:Zn-ribbon domain-containing OB-fold protein [Jongsikchunia kroppenstedtii]
MTTLPTERVRDGSEPAPPVTETVHWDLTYDIHLGATWGRFMAGLIDQKILATSCAVCGRVSVPPQAYCESCFEPTDDWIELPTEGVVEAYTVAQLGFTGGPKPPYAIAGIRLDGASTLLMHWLSGIDLSAAESTSDLVSRRVRAVWAPNRTGHILDIAHFVPVD